MGETLEHVGEVILDVGFAVDIGKKVVNVIDAGFHFVGEEGGFDIGEAAQAPAGGGHGFDQLDFDGAGGGEFVEIGVEEALEVGGRFVGEDEGDGGKGGVADGARSPVGSTGRKSVAKGGLGGAGAAFRSGGAADLAPLARAVADFLLVVGLVLVGILAPG